MAQGYESETKIFIRFPKVRKRMFDSDFVKEEARKVVNEYGRNKPPFLAEEMAPLCNVKTIEKVNMDGDGLLLPVDGGFIIQLNKNHPHVRQNFSCAHEIAHTFFYDLDESPPIKVDGIRREDEEYLCNVAAAEMLMPENYLRERVGKKPSMESLLTLTKKFHVSVQAMARRITEEKKIWGCIISQWERNSEKKFYRKWMYGPRKLRLKCTSFPSIVSNEKLGISKAYKSDKIIRTKEKLMVGRTKTTVRTESYKVSENFVISLITFPALPINNL